MICAFAHYNSDFCLYLCSSFLYFHLWRGTFIFHIYRLWISLFLSSAMLHHESVHLTKNLFYVGETGIVTFLLTASPSTFRNEYQLKNKIWLGNFSRFWFDCELMRALLLQTGKWFMHWDMIIFCNEMHVTGTFMVSQFAMSVCILVYNLNYVLADFQTSQQLKM